ncbi:MAG TPA: zf-HC2 domain-containing protein [Rhodocyclaceae bacterium]|nr:zf-HC2 domain-containing protein [Rhodocyclaceae bacterium]HNH35256.1 zf-HC2 domain-containing protein [Rhodocyclaceae bacterium]
MRCKDASRLVSQALDRPLSIGELIRLRSHLAICRGCSNYRQQMLFLRRALRRYSSGKTSAG